MPKDDLESDEAISPDKPRKPEPEKDEAPEPALPEIREEDGKFVVELSDDEPEPPRPRQERRASRYEELKERSDRLERELAELRSRPAPQPHVPEPQPEQPNEIESQEAAINLRFEQLQNEKDLLWTASATYPKGDPRLEQAVKRAKEIATEERHWTKQLAVLEVRKTQPQAQFQRPEQVMFMTLQAEYPEVLGPQRDMRAFSKYRAILAAADADGKQPSLEIARNAAKAAKAFKTAGYKDARPVSHELRHRLTGQRSAGADSGSEKVVVLNDYDKAAAKARYPGLPERDAVQRYMATRGKAIAQRRQKAG